MTRRFAFACALVALFSLFSKPAAAYPWLISHYGSCATCHVDPMGAGQLSAYGRGMADVLVRWHIDPKDLESGEPAPSSGFLWGLVTPPEWFNVSGNLRGGGIGVNLLSTPSVHPLVMAADVNATLEFKPFVAHAAVGYGMRSLGPAVVTSYLTAPAANIGLDTNGLVSREHWVGLKFFEDSLMFRAGRIPLPFGLRNNEHTSYVRSETRTDINVQQQHGVSIWYGNDQLRGELMAIAGNFQIRPDAVRERGFSGSMEWTPAQGFGLGASSLLTYSKQDVDFSVERLRNADGVFLRWAPVEQLSILAELDGLVSSHEQLTHVGATGWLQADWSIVQGIHLVPAVEFLDSGDPSGRPPAVGGWLGLAWYPLPHTEVRLDGIYRETFPTGVNPTGDLTALLQTHLFF